MADQNIYIDSTASAGGDGSELTPYNSFADINWTTGGTNSIFDWVAAADDVFINLKRSSVFRETLTVGASGVSGHPITITAYGSELVPLPVIDGTTIYDTWVDTGGGIYTLTLASVYYMVEDGSTIEVASDATLVDGNWFYSGTVLYYRPTTGTPDDHVIGVVRRISGIAVTDFIYIDIDNIGFLHNLYAVRVVPSNGSIVVADSINIETCEFTECFIGAGVYGRNGNDNTNIGVKTNTFLNCGESIYVGSFSDSTEQLIDSSVNYNTIINGGIAVGSQTWKDFINYIGNDLEGIGIQNMVNGTVIGNVIQNSCPGGGISAWVNAATTATGSVFSLNFISNLTFAAIIIGGEGANTMTNNDITFNYAYACDQGLRINRDQVPSNTFAHNSFNLCDISIHLFSLTDNAIIKNNISYNPTSYHVKCVGAILSNSLDYNSYFPVVATNFHVAGTDYTFTDYKTLIGDEANSITTDSLLTVAGKILSTSPCVDTGVTIAGINDGGEKDIDGYGVFGLAPNIGADQAYGTVRRGIPLLDRIYGEVTGLVLSTGNLVATNRYEIISTELDHFGTGVVVGDRVIGLTTALDANNTVKLLGTAQGTTDVPFRVGVDAADLPNSTNINVFTTDDDRLKNLYLQKSSSGTTRILARDGVNAATVEPFLWQASKAYKAQVTTGEDHPDFIGTPKMQLSVIEIDPLTKAEIGSWAVSAVTDFRGYFPSADDKLRQAKDSDYVLGLRGGTSEKATTWRTPS